jgi:5-formyltetrahydrofolate cyclo-ligase
VDTKATLRERALARRTSMAEAERVAATAAIAERAGAFIATLRPPRVSVYWPIGSECGTQALIEKVDALGTVVGLPALADGEIIFRRFVPGDRLIAGPFGTSEPPGDAPLVQPDVIVLPVVAFDRQGWRLGYGRGYYDRAISAMHNAGRRPHLLGIAFSVQEVEAIPAEPHDARLDCLVTEKETLNFLARGA